MAEIPNPLVALTQDDLLDLIERVLPAHYLAPLKDPGPGYEILQAYAKEFARVSLAVERAGKDAQILTAGSGVKATGTVQLYRSAAHPEAITVVVKAGTVVTTTVGGRDFVITEDVTFGPSDTGPFDVGVEAVSVGYEWNVRGKATAADGTELWGDIDAIKTLVEDPELGDLTIRVRQGTATSGGQDAALDALGLDRGIARLNGEADADYRHRVRSLPDNISPAAFDRACKSILRPYGAGYDLIETGSISYQTCYDGPGAAIGSSGYDPNLFCYDDPRPAYPFRGRWLDENDYRGAGIAVVENIQPISDVGMSYHPGPMPGTVPIPGQTTDGANYDAGPTPFTVTVSNLGGMSPSVGHYLQLTGAAYDGNNGTFLIIKYNDASSVDVWNPAAVLPEPNSGSITSAEMERLVDEVNAAALVSPQTGGSRACCAYDIPRGIAFGYREGGYDGFDLGKNSVYKGLFDQLQAIKAAGVAVSVELRGE